MQQATATRDILTGVGLVPFEWTPADDRLRWGANALDVLGLATFETISRGSLWQALTAPETPIARAEALARTVDTDRGAGIAYEARYALAPEGAGGRRIPLHETGRWFSDGRGRMVRVTGTIRRLDPADEGRPAVDIDALTGEMDRSALIRALRAAIADAEAGDTRIALVFASIDALEAINDTYGKQVGDEVLVSATRRLKDCMRAGDVIGRIGGNRFAVVLANCDGDAALVAARRFTAGVKDSAMATEIGPLWATMAFGCVAIPEQAKTLGEALECADEAMRRARRLGPGSFEIFRRNRHSTAVRLENREVAADLNRRLQAGEVRLDAVPMVDRDGHIVGHRALPVTPHTPDGAPLHVPREAERLGLSAQVDMFVLDAAVAALEADPALRLSIDVGTMALATGIWPHRARKLLMGRADIASRLTASLSALTLTAMPEAASKFAEILTGYGVALAIGDFAAPGTDLLFGLSLKPARIDVAASLVEQAAGGGDGLTLLAVTRLAATIGAVVLARGSVPGEIAPLLHAAGVDLVERPAEPTSAARDAA